MLDRDSLRAAIPQVGHDLVVVDDLVLDVDRRAVDLEDPLDDLDGTGGDFIIGVGDERNDKWKGFVSGAAEFLLSLLASLEAL